MWKIYKFWGHLDHCQDPSQMTDHHPIHIESAFMSSKAVLVIIFHYHLRIELLIYAVCHYLFVLRDLIWSLTTFSPRCISNLSHSRPTVTSWMRWCARSGGTLVHSLCDDFVFVINDFVFEVLGFHVFCWGIHLWDFLLWSYPHYIRNYPWIVSFGSWAFSLNTEDDDIFCVFWFL